MHQQNINNAYTDIISLANEITLRSYKTNWTNIRKRLFSKLSANDYAVMCLLSKDMDSSEENRKIYLEDIAQGLNLPIGIISKIARTLKERTLVTWNHDGIGEDGTYIQLTENGIRSVAEQQEILKDFYKSVIEQFGKERFIEFLNQTIELEEIMGNEISKKGEEHE